MGGRPDCMKKPLAWAPVMKPSLGPTPVNCSMCRIRSWGRISHGSMLGLTGAWGWDLKHVPELLNSECGVPVLS